MPLIKTIEQLRPFVPIGAANGVKSIPDMAAPEEQYLVPIMGQDLYDSLQESFDDNTLSPEQEKLLQRCRAIIAPFAFLMQMPFIQTLLSDNGLIALQSENSRKAYKWEYNAVERALADRGYKAQEACILFLEKNKADYPEWEDSPYNSTTGFCLIRNGAELKGLLGLDQPHRCFLLLRPMFNTVESLYLLPSMGRDFYDAYNSRLVSGPYVEDETALLKDLQMAAARLAMKHAATELTIQFGAAGFTVVDGSFTKDNEHEGKVVASDTQIGRFAADMERVGLAVLQRAVATMNEKASVSIFPEYFASSLYTAPSTEGTDDVYKNRGRRGFFVAG